MLQLNNIKKSYTTGNFTQVALNGVSLSFRDSEFAAILGPSGSGKTTMLNIIGGLDHYDSGDLVIDGISTKNYKDRDWDTFRNNRVGFVFQSYNLIPHQTILANVELALTLSGVGKDERRRRAVEALDKVGLKEHINKKPAQLSGGQMQRVAIARALINDPEILLADEPTGALDSKTSVQIMDLLQEIAQERLVVMVTHNPELAEQYATRIVTLADGEIKADTDPFNPAPEDMRASRKKIRQTKMSFLTALSLSFNNLMTKKGRTIMTAFAGSIGIIGIAAILALANGVNGYIKTVEEETLSSYPLQITSTSFDMTAMMTGMSGASADDSEGTSSYDAAAKELESPQANAVRQISIIGQIFSSVGSNDLASLKEFLDANGGNINDYASGIEYTYNVTPQIFDANTDDGVYQINPDDTLNALGMGSTITSSAIMSTMMSTDIFGQMPDRSLFEDSYELVAGSWPEQPNECILVLTENGSIADYALYLLGLRDRSELEDYVKAFVNEEEITVAEDTRQYTYDDFLNLKLKWVTSADFYEYDADHEVWVDKSDNAEYMKAVVDAGEDLVISGIIQRTSDNAVLNSGIYYTSDLIDHIIEVSAEKQIVKDQLANPTINVLTGKSFAEEAEDDSSAFDMDSLFSIDEEALQNAFKFDESALGNVDTSSLGSNLGALDASSLGSMPQMDASAIMSQLGTTGTDASASGVSINNEAAAKMMSELMASYMAANPGTTPDEAAISAYMGTEAAQAIIANYMSSVIDTSALAAAQQVQTQSLVSAMQTYMQQAMSEYMAQVITALTQQMQSSIEAMMTQTIAQITSGMADAMSVDTDAFADAFQVNMNEDDLSALIMSLFSSSDSSYDGNLAKFDYADKSKPYEIDIYAKDFEAKGHITDILDQYNADKEAAGDDDQVITYTDIVGALMSSVTTIIDMISYVLIAFVSISLIVSSIMIGVITYISVLERKKEIGILRAIGASKGNISQVFNAETVIEGLIAGLLGVGVTALCCIPASAIVYKLFDVPNIAVLPVNAAVTLVIISVVLTFIAGLIPASSASRKDPVEALRSE